MHEHEHVYVYVHVYVDVNMMAGDCAGFYGLSFVTLICVTLKISPIPFDTVAQKIALPGTDLWRQV